MVTLSCVRLSLFFFFQAEDGIRDLTVTGVQTCALPIFAACVALRRAFQLLVFPDSAVPNCPLEYHPAGSSFLGTTTRRNSLNKTLRMKIGRASCRERV